MIGSHRRAPCLRGRAQTAPLPSASRTSWPRRAPFCPGRALAFRPVQVIKAADWQSGFLDHTYRVPVAFPPLSPSLARALAEHDYAEPTPVQTAVLDPQAMARDLLVSAQTGSGKTVAYGLAILSPISRRARNCRAQRRAARPHRRADARTRPAGPPRARLALPLCRARVVSCVGGMDSGVERRQLAAGAHIVVGTPGRLRDHLERGNLDVSNLKAVVLDEADEMLDLGFREDLEFILDTTPAERARCSFSATLPKGIVALAKRYQNAALRIDVSDAERAHADIEYRAVRVAPNDIGQAVVNLLALLRRVGRAGVLQYARSRAAPASEPDRAWLSRRGPVRRAQPGRAQSRDAGAARADGRASASRPTSPRAASICPVSISSSTPNCRTTPKCCSTAADAPAAPGARALASSW